MVIADEKAHFYRESVHVIQDSFSAFADTMLFFA
jgi:hypothetical protein